MGLNIPECFKIINNKIIVKRWKNTSSSEGEKTLKSFEETREGKEGQGKLGLRFLIKAS